MIWEVQSLLKERNTAFKSGDVALYIKACAKHPWGKVRLQEKDWRTHGQQLKQAGLAEELTLYFARFEVGS